MHIASATVFFFLCVFFWPVKKLKINTFSLSISGPSRVNYLLVYIVSFHIVFLSKQANFNVVVSIYLHL